MIASVVIFINTLNPLLTVAGAANNLNMEIETRVNSSPLRAITMIGPILEHGTTEVNFNFRDNRMSANGNVTLLSDFHNREFALLGGIGIPLMHVDFEAYLNRERLAARIPLMGMDFYGIIFNTFRHDLHIFGSMFGLDTAELDTVVTMVEEWERLINADSVSQHILAPYLDILESFVRELNHTSERVDISVGSQQTTARVTRVEFTITETDIINLLRNLYTVLENDETMRSLPNINDTLREVRRLISYVERNLDVRIRPAFYVGSDNRMMRITIHGDSIYNNERTHIDARADFGASANDRWELFIAATSDFNETSININWEYNETPAGYENVITFYEDGLPISRIIITWNPHNGVFTRRDDIAQIDYLTGVFTTDYNGGFSLRVNDFSSGRSFMMLDIEAKPGAEIETVEFINLDRWSMTLIHDLQRSLLGFLF